MIDPPDEPPPELDGGRITANSGFDLDDELETWFDGEHYQPDHRTSYDPERPLPDWLVPGAVAVQFQGYGSAYAGAFTTEVILPAALEIVAPPVSAAPLHPVVCAQRWQPSAQQSTKSNARIPRGSRW